MENKLNDPEIINDLIRINNDRVQGYKEALDLAHGLGLDSLRHIFAKYILQSQHFIEELTPYVVRQGEEPTDATLLRGKLFRMWMGLKATVAGNDRKSLLESCEKGEDAFKDTYKKTLSDEETLLTGDVKNIMLNQLGKQLDAHNEIKALRDNATL